MFGLSLTHMILFGIIALIFIGPEQLPEVARTIGKLLNELRRATQDFQSQFTGQFKDQANTFNEIRHQITNLEADAPPPANAHHDHGHHDHGHHDHGHHDHAHTGHGPEAHQGHTGHGPEAHQGHPTSNADQVLPSGTPPVSEDDKGNKS